MSGIVGVFYFDGRTADRADLERMVDCIAHRGPDGKAIWNQGPVGLGHRMLHTTPESLTEMLPLLNQSRDLALTADARIDNRDDLIKELGLGGRPPGEVADSELILAAYERWGEGCVEKLIGDFTFAVWEAKRQTLFCARDHMGVKPFYYHRGKGLFVFGSEIKALLCLPDVPRRLNEVRVADYLCSMLEDKEITFYEDILRLPPAHTLTVRREESKPRQYWCLDPSREVRMGSDEEYAEAFRSIFTEAVRCRLRSAFPIGSMLSGGLDSSSITCVARKVMAEKHERRLHTFSATFEEVPQCDERPFINAVIAGDDLDSHFVRADRLSPLTELERVFHHEDEPFYAGNLFIHWALFTAAQQQNVRVLLDGIDGDTTVSHGIGYLSELVRSGRWRSLAREVAGLARNFRQPRRKIIWRHCVRPSVPHGVRDLWRKLSRRRWQPMGIDRAFARRIELSKRWNTIQGDRQHSPRTSKEDHWRRLTSGIVPFVLEVEDRAMAAFSIEVRYPFFDKRLVEFCLALPPEQKVSEGWTRIVLRRAMAGILPEEIRWRGGKSDLSPNFARALRLFERERLESALWNDAQELGIFMDLDVLQARSRQYLDGKASDMALPAWKAITLLLWLRHTGLKPPPPPTPQ